jgi:hypothetical protein
MKNRSGTLDDLPGIADGRFTAARLGRLFGTHP